MSSGTIKLTLAAVVCLAGVALVYRTYTTNVAAPSPEPEPPQTTLPEFEDVMPGFVAAANMTFNERPTSDSVPRVARAAAETLAEAAPAQLVGDAALPQPLVRNLADTFERHLAVILSADYDEWLSFAESVGATFTAPAGEEGGPPTRETFASRAKSCRLAPVNTRHVSVRPLALKGREVEHDSIGGSIVGKAFSDYGAPEPDSADIYEIIIPMKLDRLRDSAPERKMNMCFAYAWSRQLQRWDPCGFTGQTDLGAQYSPIGY